MACMTKDDWTIIPLCCLGSILFQFATTESLPSNLQEGSKVDSDGNELSKFLNQYKM